MFCSPRMDRGLQHTADTTDKTDRLSSALVTVYCAFQWVAHTIRKLLNTPSPECASMGWEWCGDCPQISVAQPMCTRDTVLTQPNIYLCMYIYSLFSDNIPSILPTGPKLGPALACIESRNALVARKLCIVLCCAVCANVEDTRSCCFLSRMTGSHEHETHRTPT